MPSNRESQHNKTYSCRCWCSSRRLIGWLSIEGWKEGMGEGLRFIMLLRCYYSHFFSIMISGAKHFIMKLFLLSFWVMAQSLHAIRTMDPSPLKRGSGIDSTFPHSRPKSPPVYVGSPLCCGERKTHPEGLFCLAAEFHLRGSQVFLEIMHNADTSMSVSGTECSRHAVLRGLVERERPASTGVKDGSWTALTAASCSTTPPPLFFFFLPRLCFGYIIF